MAITWAIYMGESYQGFFLVFVYREREKTLATSQHFVADGRKPKTSKSLASIAHDPDLA